MTLTSSGHDQHWGREVLRWTMLSAVIVAIVGIFQFGIGGWPPVPVVVHDLTLGFLVCFAISALAWSLLPRVARRVRYHHPVLRWLVMATVMTACGAVGLWVAVLIIHLAGLLPDASISLVFRRNLVGVVTVTLIVGTVFTILGAAQERLETTEL